ncbi:LysE family translocator [Micromonospora sp. M12]
MVAAIGCTLGTVPHLLASVSGLATLLAASPTAFRAITFVGVGYLLYLAWSTIRDRSTFTPEADPTPHSALRVIVKAVLINLLNPKPTLFFVAFLPQFVDPAAPTPPAACWRPGWCSCCSPSWCSAATGWPPPWSGTGC